MASKTVFITGTSSGIGLATAKLFYSHGWNVIATLRSPEKDVELKKLDTSRILIQAMDVSQTESIKTAIDVGLTKFGRIDVLVNNAGYGQYGIFEVLDEQSWRKQFNVNVFGMTHSMYMARIYPLSD
jgi:NAD(P)-dependent dehydrogenase (short-subunit alcohol dehydrogenase family)